MVLLDLTQRYHKRCAIEAPIILDVKLKKSKFRYFDFVFEEPQKVLSNSSVSFFFYTHHVKAQLVGGGRHFN